MYLNLIEIAESFGVSEKVVEDWSGQQLFAPTNIAFFGEGLNQLAIACFGSDTIFALDVPWSGRPLTYPGLGNG